MTGKPKLVNITMVRDNLDDILEYPLPDGYQVRLFQSGDEKAFDEVWIDADPHGHARVGLFEEEFRKYFEHVPERMHFLIDPEGRPVGTATAWFNDDFHGARWGVVHWVAIVRGEQGRGLSKPLMSVVLRRLRDLGHDRALLITQTVRLTAISLYMGLGFNPLVKTDEDAANWAEVRASLKKLSR